MTENEDELFDLSRLRRNWSPASPEEEKPAVHPALADVVAEPDPLESALQLVADLRASSLARFPEFRTSLEPFLDELARGVEGILTESNAKKRAAFLEALDRFEDLLEAFVLTERR